MNSLLSTMSGPKSLWMRMISGTSKVSIKSSIRVTDWLQATVL